MFKFFALVLLFQPCAYCRYIEGVLRTNEKWTFLARFCFLSEEGQFEYEIDYNEDQGELNLLLYYDTEDQWPAVYKSNKTCDERESVLNVGQNQIVNLTTNHRVREYSGCNYLQESVATSKSYTVIVPTLSTPTTYKDIKNGRTHLITTATVPQSTITTNDYTAYTSLAEETSEATTELMESTTDATGVSSTVQEMPTSTRELAVDKRSVPQIMSRYVLRSRMVSCHNARRFRSSRERWWFIALSNCRGSKGISVRYRILMTNGAPGDYWHEHFSADEFYILPVLMAFSIAYSLLMLGIVMCSMELKSRQLLHTTYKIYVFSVVLQLFGILFVSSCYVKLAVTGLVTPRIKRLGMVLMSASETTFLLLLLLLAKGYTITRGRLPLPASVKLTIFMCLYVVTYTSIFIYEAEVFDPGEVLYLYESPAGYSLIILRILAWCMFVYSTIFTLKHYPEKGNFYYPFNIFGTTWFVAGPAFILSANTYIDKWVRESVVCAVLLFISFGGHLMFLLLTMPSVANKNFPYHVRTTQIGIMEITGTAGSGTMEQFGHHMYEPSTTIREQTVIIPLTRRTEEIFEDMYNQRALHHNIPEEQEPQQRTVVDTALENVLNWSAVKNVPAVPAIEFERTNRRNSTDSSMTDNSNALNVMSRSPSFKDKPTSTFEDYVKEVPIELFTVSKMVVTTNTLRRKSVQDKTV